jgi:hypothetical protein
LKTRHLRFIDEFYEVKFHIPLIVSSENFSNLRTKQGVL